MILKPNTGIDISDYQPGLKIATLNPLPRFVIAKATESMTFRCKTTVDFAAQSKALGIPYGFYHFWQNVDPFKQASNYIAQVNLAGGFERIPPVLDLEVGGLVDSHIKTWLDVVEDVAGKRPILYSNKYHFDMIADNAWFKNYDVWTAAYPSNPDLWLWCPPLYSEKRARREVMWQYGSTYKYQNYTANSIDTNIAITDFLNEIGAVTTPPPIGEPMAYKATAIYNDTRLRIFHNTLSTSTSIGYYPAGTVFEGNNIWTATAADMVAGQAVGDKWLQTVKPIAGWVAIVHGGKAYCNLETVTPPPPPAEIVKELNMQLATGSVVTYTENGVEKWKVTA